ncbi:MAG: hypothetical protein NW204_13550 [Xanthomonadaceae bacterium]|nr:hypothetical protein [Xanthomonadaceae bacterium]
MLSKAITTTPVAGRLHSTWDRAGVPGPGAFDSTLNGVILEAPIAGAIPFDNPVSGNTYLNRFFVSASTGNGIIMLADRLWHNGGFTITSTSAQNITSPTWPARDANGTTNGDGVFLGIEVSAQTGAGTPTITVSYTNSEGTSGRTGTNSDATTSTSPIGSFFRIGLQAGDRGVRSVQSVTLSATWTSGTINLVAYRPIAVVPIYGTDIPGAVDTLTGGLPRLFNNSVLWTLFQQSATGAFRLNGAVQVTQG